MAPDPSLHIVDRLVRRVRRAAQAVAVLGAIGLAIALIWPLPTASAGSASVARQHTRLVEPASPDTNSLVVRMAGRTLVRPPRVKAAVKDTGTAAQLLKRLKLQGVVDMAGTPVAYVQVDPEGIKTVRKGDRLLDFIVQDLRPGELTLTLEGVEVRLTH